ncbi:hypothetical protein RND81_02G066200 [Saponaria officinalis]|uniref:Polyprotein n=1 Tax=Saponaria officinalis TaxID=3572 RepID=A0AAW1MW41_SAPOF
MINSESGQIIDPSKPPSYSLAHVEHTSHSITPIVFNGNNYDEWSRSFHLALMAKGKLGYIYGIVTKPAVTSDKFESWQTTNALVTMWIFNTLAPSVRKQIGLRPEAKQIWIYQLQTELLARRQGPTEPLVAYYGRMIAIWYELLEQEPLPTCSCNPCTYEWVALMTARHEKKRVRDFLMGLDDRFSNTRTHIIGITHLPSLDLIYNRLLQDEGVRNLSSTLSDTAPDAMAFAARVSHRSRQSGDGIRKECRTEPSKYFCIACDKSGHSLKFCYQVTGKYPEWWGDRPRPPHMASGKAPATAHMASGKAPASHAASSSSRSSLATFDQLDLNSLTPEQLDVLDNLVQARKADSTTSRLNGNIYYLPWIIDTGASHHMSGCLSHFTNLQLIAPLSVSLPNGDLTIATQSGDVILSPRLVLRNVLYVANLYCNLLSVSSLLMDTSLTIQFSHNLCLIQDRISKTVIGAGEQNEGLYHLNGVRNDKAHAYMIGTGNSPELWHRRLGHLSSNISRFLPFLNKSSQTCDTFHSKTCDICLRAKQTREHFNLSISHALSPFDLIHCDLWGPYSENASCGSSHFLTIVNDFSRSTWVYLLRNKSDTKQTLENGILFQSSNVGSTTNPHQRVERKHRHILNVARALLFQASLPLYFWGECVLSVVYLINRTPTSLLNGKTPYQNLFNKPPPFENIRTFECLAYAKTLNRSRDKFASWSRKCVCIGYPFGKKGWRLFDLDTGSYFESREVVFLENEFPYKNLQLNNLENDPPFSMDNLSPVYDSSILHTPHPSHTTDPPASPNSSPNTETLSNPQSPPNTPTDPPQPTPDLDQPPTTSSSDNPSSLPPVSSTMGRGHRIKMSNSNLNGFVLSKPRPLVNSLSAQSSSTGTPYPISHYLNYANFSPNHKAFLSSVTKHHEPSFLKDVVQGTPYPISHYLKMKKDEEEAKS